MKQLMIKLSLIFTLSFSLLSQHCFATESNLDDFKYPSHSCGEKIKKPKKPEKSAAYEDIDEYNINVATYNKEINIYKSCINRYINNGNHDINIIRKRLNSALKEARKL